MTCGKLLAVPKHADWASGTACAHRPLYDKKIYADAQAESVTEHLSSRCWLMQARHIAGGPSKVALRVRGSPFDSVPCWAWVLLPVARGADNFIMDKMDLLPCRPVLP